MIYSIDGASIWKLQQQLKSNENIISEFQPTLLCSRLHSIELENRGRHKLLLLLLVGLVVM
jgi:hypothetical protein